MSNRWFILAIVSAVALIVAYPLFQLWQTGGYLFYCNGHDETTYLQYDFSCSAQGPTRVAQYLVTGLHHLGLSGGWINLLFDVACPVGFIVLASLAFRQIGYDGRRSNLYAFCIAFLPLMFGGLNPYIFKLFLSNWHSGKIFWLSVPEAVFPPLVRTPEPQFSLLLLAAAVWWSLKKRSFWWMYPVLPFLYGFVAIPTAFVVISLHLPDLLPAFDKHRWAAPIAAWLSICAAMAVYTNLLVSSDMRALLAPTRLPMLSFTGGLCCAIVVAAWLFGERRLRYPLVVIALAPFAALNHHILGGWMAQPNNFEQYVGVICAACVLLFAVDLKLFRKAAFVAAIYLLFYSARREFQVNLAINETVDFHEHLAEKLETQPEAVAVNDVHMSSRLNMVYPRQKSTAFGFEKTLVQVSSREHVKDYLNAKTRIVNDPRLAGRYAPIFGMLDRSYVYCSGDFPLLHSGRRASFAVFHQLELNAEDVEPVVVYPVFVRKTQ